MRVRDGARGTGRKQRVLEPQWGEQPILEHLRQRLSIKRLGDEPQQYRVGVRIVVARSGCEVGPMAIGQRERAIGDWTTSGTFETEADPIRRVRPRIAPTIFAVPNS